LTAGPLLRPCAAFRLPLRRYDPCHCARATCGGGAGGGGGSAPAVRERVRVVASASGRGFARRGGTAGEGGGRGLRPPRGGGRDRRVGHGAHPRTPGRPRCRP